MNINLERRNAVRKELSAYVQNKLNDSEIASMSISETQKFVQELIDVFTKSKLDLPVFEEIIASFGQISGAQLLSDNYKENFEFCVNVQYIYMLHEKKFLEKGGYENWESHVSRINRGCLWMLLMLMDKNKITKYIINYGYLIKSKLENEIGEKIKSPFDDQYKNYIALNEKEIDKAFDFISKTRD